MASRSAGATSTPARKRERQDIMNDTPEQHSPKTVKKIKFMHSMRNMPGASTPIDEQTTSQGLYDNVEDTELGRGNDSHDEESTEGIMAGSNITGRHRHPSQTDGSGTNALELVVNRLKSVEHQNSILQKDVIVLKEAVLKLTEHGLESVKLNDCIERMKDQLLKMKQDLKSKQQEFDRLAEDAERIGAARQRNADFDGIAEDKFRDLQRLVKSFVRDTCASRIRDVSLPDELREVFGKISSHPAERLLNSGLHARLFVQSLVWQFLCTNILDNPFKVWGKEVLKLVNAVLSMYPCVCPLCPVANANYYSLLYIGRQEEPLSRRELWRTMTGGLLSNLRPKAKRIQGWETSLASHIEPLILDNVDKDRLSASVTAIISHAVELAKILARSRTRCVIKRENLITPFQEALHQLYDGRWMEVIEQSVSPGPDYIDFVVSPTLAERTNSASEQFQIPRVLVKAEVCCGKSKYDFYDPF